MPYQNSPDWLGSQNRSPVILPTSSRIYTGQLSKRKCTGSNQNEHSNETVGEGHRPALDNCESHSGSNTGPTVTDDPTGSYGLQRLQTPAALGSQGHSLDTGLLDRAAVLQPFLY